MTQIAVGLTDRGDMAYVPLAALGYALRRARVLEPLNQVSLPIKTIDHSPGDKLFEALILIMAGGRATSQVDLLLRPNRGLAQAWGQSQFAQQSTRADALDAFDEASLNSLRSAFETILCEWSSGAGHDFRTGRLFVADDLTGLPAARCAAGSTQGYFAGEKTERVVKSRASV